LGDSHNKFSIFWPFDKENRLILARLHLVDDFLPLAGGIDFVDAQFLRETASSTVYQHIAAFGDAQPFKFFLSPSDIGFGDIDRYRRTGSANAQTLGQVVVHAGRILILVEGDWIGQKGLTGSNFIANTLGNAGQPQKKANAKAATQGEDSVIFLIANNAEEVAPIRRAISVFKIEGNYLGESLTDLVGSDRSRFHHHVDLGVGIGAL
jgi:hypothetical protein